MNNYPTHTHTTENVINVVDSEEQRSLNCQSNVAPKVNPLVFSLHCNVWTVIHLYIHIFDDQLKKNTIAGPRAQHVLSSKSLLPTIFTIVWTFTLDYVQNKKLLSSLGRYSDMQGSIFRNIY